MVLVLVKVFKVVVLARFIHLKNKKLINVALKSPPFKIMEAMTVPGRQPK